MFPITVAVGVLVHNSLHTSVILVGHQYINKYSVCISSNTTIYNYYSCVGRYTRRGFIYVLIIRAPLKCKDWLVIFMFYINCTSFQNATSR
jgi:membrane-anchored protein YejM (alkaline phosphatase superfamily)